MGSGRFVSCAAALVLACAAAPATAATITVTTTADEMTLNGRCSLREAIAAVNTPGSIGDCTSADDQSNTIVLGAPEYELTIDPDASDLQQTGDLDITGTTPLTIEGTGATAIKGVGLQDRILHVHAGANVTIEHVTITGGHAPNGANGANGMTNPVMTAASAGLPGAPGGGIRNDGTLTLEDSAVTNNTAGSGGRGGAGPPDALGNNAGMPGGAGGGGGGIYNVGVLTLRGVTVSGNVAGDGGTGGAGGDESTGPIGGTGGAGGCCGDGGGLDNAGGQVIVSGSLFANNHAGAGGSGGPGKSPQFGSPGIGGVGGQGQGGSSGGGIATSGAAATVSITNTTLSGNVSGPGGNGGGGGATTAAPINNFPSGGNAGNGSAGGGLFVSGGATVALTNVTVNGNHVGGPGTPGAAGTEPPCTGPNCGLPQPGAPGNPAFGGGVYDSTTPATTLTDTLLASNELGNCAGNIADGGANLSFGVSTGCPSGFAHGDPKLGPLADNGGPTETEAPQTGSAAIDQGASCATTDQRGLPRPSGAACDIGAYEVTPPAVSGVTASAITTTGGTVTGSVTANQATALVHVDFGTTNAYGSTAPAPNAAGLAPQQISTTLAELQPNTTYHFRLTVTSPDGTTSSADQTFTTAALPKAPPPKLSHLKVTVRRKHGLTLTITYADSEPAATTFTISIKKHKHFVATKQHITHMDHAGKNTIRFKPKKLKRGRYRLTGVARAGTAQSNLVSARFKVATSKPGRR